MRNDILRKGLVFGIIILFVGVSVLQQNHQTVKADPITWDVAVNFSETGGKTDNVIFGEAPDARDGPPADSYDVVKSPPSMVPYTRAYLKDNLVVPYDKIWYDYRQYPDTDKVWNLSVQWYPLDEASPTTLTMSWSTAEVDDSEYTTVYLCTNTGTVLKNMLVDTSYTFSCPALTIQNFKIICIANWSRYDVNHDGKVNFQDAGLVWVHRTTLVPYDGVYDVNQDGNVNFQDAGLTWVHRD